MKKVVLAYSGGLDTTCAVHWLKQNGFSVICFVADLGQGQDMALIKQRALAAGAQKVQVKDLREEFIQDFILPALKANAVYEGKYLLATALGRPLIAKHLVELAIREKAGVVAHGCTGKGNDQVRFEVSVKILNPDLEVIAPLRVWGFKSREEEIDYAKKFNLPVDVTKKKPYSIDRNLWGVSIEAGILEDLAIEPPESVYQITKSPSAHPGFARYLEIYFEKGIPKKIDGKPYALIKLIQELNRIGGLYGVGRSDLVENRLVGIKSREVYEAPAATILYIAHKELENLVSDRLTQHFKETVSLKYAQLVYDGLWYSRLKEALDRFIDSTQRDVTGSIRVKLFKGSCSVVARKSRNSLYKKELATYGKEDLFDQKLAKGFIEIWGMPYRKK
ncbi:MAG: argininosuccinate synthase [Candidatus Omnitrophota bacterium]|jgi:argininosuccinate synthase